MPPRTVASRLSSSTSRVERAGDERPRFSVLIPLEFTRGIALQCLQAWAKGMDYSRRGYEILLAAPDDHDQAELQLLEALLDPRDRVISLPCEHDMDLVAAAAEVAEGEVLVFTESHCIPEPDFLAACERAFAANPSWDGFSGRSIPLTHNLLSVIEAEMYVADIAENLGRHPWLKVLDQCFVVKRTAYERSGGIEPRFGHFAEHLLAARLRRSGAVIGHHPGAAISHHYVGERADLIDFARDFGRGRVIFAAGAEQDDCGDLFEAPAEWRTRFGRDRGVARRMAAMLIRDMPAALREGSPEGIDLVPQKRVVPLDRARWILMACVPTRIGLLARRMNLRLGALRLEADLRLRSHQRAKAAFLRLNDAAATLGGEEALAELQGLEGRVGDFEEPEGHRSEWTALTSDLVPAVGFHALERLERRPFRWSAPAAMVSLPELGPGATVEIAWGRIDGQGHEVARFYANERRIPSSQITHARHSTQISLDRPSGALRLGWVAGSRHGRGDPRRLGLPVERISWSAGNGAPSPAVHSQQSTSAGLGEAGWRRPASASRAGSDPIYLMHIHKSAGTSLRVMISDAFAADEQLAPTQAVYYAAQLRESPKILQRKCALAVGHFGVDLPTATPDRSWRVMTVLREPLDRLRSLHGYLLQNSFIDEAAGFESWAEHQLRLEDCLGGHFLAGGLLAPGRGLKAVSAELIAAQSQLTEALLRCEVVGVYERLADTTNLLCAATGALPPLEPPRLNPTFERQQRPAAEDLGPAGERLLAIERRLHRLATQVFERQLGDLYEGLAQPGTAALSSADAACLLRRRWFDREASLAPAANSSKPIAWLPGDPFPGDNLHAYEEHHGGALRWTGPGETTRVHVLIDTSRRWHLRVGLHPATPREHSEKARLMINGRPVELIRSATRDQPGPPLAADSMVLHSTIEPADAPAESAPFSTLEIHSPVRRGSAEFRQLGLGLTGVLLEPRT